MAERDSRSLAATSYSCLLSVFQFHLGGGCSISRVTNLIAMGTTGMKRAFLLLATIFLIVASATTSAVAAGPEVKTIVTQMKRGLQGPDNAVRIMKLKVISNGSSAVEWKMVQANGNANGAHWILTVVLAPPDARGIAFLDKEETSATSTVKYAYLPATKRVLEFTPVEGYDAFFATDFSYQDLGFVLLGGGGEKLVGTETRDGKKVYKLEDYPINHPLLLQGHKLRSDRFTAARRARFFRPRWQPLQDRALHDRDGRRRSDDHENRDEQRRVRREFRD